MFNELECIEERLSCTKASRVYSQERLGNYLPCGDERVDGILGGGFPFGTITEIAGEDAMGKSQLCMQLTARALARGYTVYYCDTEHSSSLTRMKEIFGKIAPDSEFPWAKLFISENKHFRAVVMNLAKLSERKHSENTVLVLDSVAAPFRGYMHKDIAIDLCDLSTNLSRLALQHNMAVICTNQMTSTTTGSDDDWQTVPALGVSWSHRPAIRIWMHKNDGFFSLELIKCPWRPKASCEYVITGTGIVGKEEEVPAQ